MIRVRVVSGVKHWHILYNCIQIYHKLPKQAREWNKAGLTVSDQINNILLANTYIKPVKYHKAFVYLWDYPPSPVCVNQQKGTSLCLLNAQENRFLSLTAFTKATNLVVSLISYSYLIWKFNCYFNITIIALNRTIRLIPPIGIKNYPSQRISHLQRRSQWANGELGFLLWDKSLTLYLGLYY